MNEPIHHAPEITGENLKILVVDDEPMLRSVIEEFLELLGCQDTLAAGNGFEALELIRNHELDCVISDIRMPEMELEALLKVIRSEFPRLSVIATSGYNDIESACDIIEAGAQDFLGKPLDLDALEITLNRVGQRKRLLEALESAGFMTLKEIARDQVREKLDRLSDEINSCSDSFSDFDSHAHRVWELGRSLDLDLEPSSQTLLETACLLHECGCSFQTWKLHNLARPFESRELELIRINQKNSGIFLSDILDMPGMNNVVGNHLEWVHGGGSCGVSDHLTTMLGLLNSIDGYLNPRPDRPAHDLPELKAWLEKLSGDTSIGQIDHLLDQWESITEYYASRPGRSV
jgi:CheY-like chemotaxis protein